MTTELTNIADSLAKILANNANFEQRLAALEAKIIESNGLRVTPKTKRIDHEVLNDKIIQCIKEHGPRLSIAKIAATVGHCIPIVITRVNSLRDKGYVNRQHGKHTLTEKGKARLRALTINSIETKDIPAEKKPVVDAVDSACSCKINNDVSRSILRFVAINGPSLNYESLNAIASRKKIGKLMRELKHNGSIRTEIVDRLKFNYFVNHGALAGHSDSCTNSK